jgi:hypothetical protein
VIAGIEAPISAGAELAYLKVDVLPLCQGGVTSTTTWGLCEFPGATSKLAAVYCGVIATGPFDAGALLWRTTNVGVRMVSMVG